MDDNIVISNQNQELILSNAGASVTCWSIDGVKILREPEQPSAKYTGRHSAAYVVPGYFGRIPDGKILFEGVEYPVPQNSNEYDPINKNLCLHGFGPTAKWDLIESTQNTAQFFTSINFLPDNYPFPYQASVLYELKNNAFNIHIKLTADKRGPFSLTWHPFFMRHIGTGSEHLTAKFSASKVFPRSMIPLPFSAPVPTPECWDYSAEYKNVVAPSDSSYLEWDGKKGVKLKWSNIKGLKANKSEVNIDMYSFLKVHNKERTLMGFHLFTDLSDSVCIEPTTSVANGFWLVEKKIIDPEYGYTILNKGETMELKIVHQIKVI